MPDPGGRRWPRGQKDSTTPNCDGQQMYGTCPLRSFVSFIFSTFKCGMKPLSGCGRPVNVCWFDQFWKARKHRKALFNCGFLRIYKGVNSPVKVLKRNKYKIAETKNISCNFQLEIYTYLIVRTKRNQQRNIQNEASLSTVFPAFLRPFSDLKFL